MELGESSSYGEASELLDLVLKRIHREENALTETMQWLPSLEAVHTLISTFGKKSDDESVPQYKVQALLCCIASYVEPTEFGDLLLKVCRLHLDSWGTFHAVHDEWFKHRIGKQPQNPGVDNYLFTAMENWGFGALPGLLELINHPHANKLIPEVILRIVSQPWASKREKTFRTLVDDFNDGVQRRLIGRVLRQPDDIYQEMTDVAARALGTQLTVLVHQLRDEQTAGGINWNEKNMAYRMGGLLNVVANTPSPEIVDPVMYALVNGFLNIYSAIDAVKGLIRQGLFIENPAVVARIETLYTEGTKAKWLDDSMRRALLKLCQLMFFVRPVSLLNKPLSYYIAESLRFSHINEVINYLAMIPSEESWCCLLELGKISAIKGKLSEEFISALASALRSDHFTEFLSLITDGTLFGWCQSVWSLEEIAPHIFRVIGDDDARLEAFLEACDRSGSPFADRFACAVLTLMPGGDSVRLRYGLAALDAGRVMDSHSSVYLMMKAMFKLDVPLDRKGCYEVHQKSCNNLRREIYSRARGSGLAATVSRRLLADIECQRRTSGRPTDESRHPAMGDGIAWTEVLAIAG